MAEFLGRCLKAFLPTGTLRLLSVSILEALFRSLQFNLRVQCFAIQEVSVSTLQVTLRQVHLMNPSGRVSVIFGELPAFSEAI
jgi:hypothetical protein